MTVQGISGTGSLRIGAAFFVSTMTALLFSQCVINFLSVKKIIIV